MDGCGSIASRVFKNKAKKAAVLMLKIQAIPHPTIRTTPMLRDPL